MQRNRRTVGSSLPNTEVMWSMDPPSIEAMTKTYVAWLSQASRVREEAFRFAQDRFTQDLEAAARLARCATLTEAFTLEAEIATKMAADYFTESQKMVELFGEMTKGVFSTPKTDRSHH